METKKEKALRLLKTNEKLLTCPVCSETLAANDDYTLKCSNNHSFDISKKGVVNLRGKGNDKLYDASLFESRREIIKSGCYNPLINTLCKTIVEYSSSDPENIRIIDAGCGEGSFINYICNQIHPRLSIGIDLSKPGIDLATSNDSDTIWLMDDLANLHLTDDACDVIINILSPASYNQFKRIISHEGIIFKVIPGKNYLTEIRELISNNSGFDNSETIAHTSKSMNIIHEQRIEYSLHLSKEQFEAVTRMTPMTHDFREANPKRRSVCGISSPLEMAYGLTIDLHILVGKPY